MYSKKVKDEVIDLTDTIRPGTTMMVDYVCEVCEGDIRLVSYRKARIDNPFAGLSFIYPNCDKVYDSSLEKMRHAERPIMPIVDVVNPWDSPVETIEEDLGDTTTTEIEDIDVEADRQMEVQGFHLVESKTELPASGRTIIRHGCSSDNERRET